MADILPASGTDEIRAALTFLYGPLPRGEREEQLAAMLGAHARGEISLEDLLVARDDGRIAGVMLSVPRPGRASFLWPPVLRDGPDAEALSDALLAATSERLDARQTVFAQVLLEPDDSPGRERFARAGYPYVTDMLLLVRELDAAVPTDDLSPVPTCTTYAAAQHARFALIIEETYRGSRDCPALAGRRTGDEALAGHRASGEFDPSRWLLYEAGGHDAGVMLLADHPERDAWEVVYLGVVPEARRRGLARAMLADACDRARRAGRTRLEVAVDAQNDCAVRLYESLGFSQTRRLAVHLRLGPIGERGA
jgi:ribosomal protein S18 acetylase RimI-like enzyme